MRDRMGSQHYHNNNQKGTNEDVDRLSSLSDDLIHKIFSSYSTILFVQTSVLSSRWRFIWTSVPCLNLSTQDFKTSSRFSKFVTRFLSRRNNKLDVSSVKLTFPGDENLGFGFVKEIMDYAFYHNVQQLNVSYLPDGDFNLCSVPPLQIPNWNCFPDTGKSIWELPALTTLYLQCALFGFEYNDSLFSSCANLMNLTLDSCQIKWQNNFSISHSRLSNLTLDNSFTGMMFVNVDTPKLENLTIRNRSSKKYVIEISAPHLTSFVYEGNDYISLSLSPDGFNSLKEADICISKPKYEPFGHILSLLQHLHNVKFLTLNMEILERLSSYDMKEISSRPFTFTNLKRLKVYPSESVFSRQQTPNKSYFLDSSPGATLEEIVAQSLMLELQVLIEEEKGNAETDSRAHKEQGKDPMESHKAKTFKQGKPQDLRLQNGKSITVKNKSYRENPRLQIEKRVSKETLIISKLWRIELLLAKLPASKKALIQPCLASLRADIDIMMGGITGSMKT